MGGGGGVGGPKGWEAQHLTSFFLSPAAFFSLSGSPQNLGGPWPRPVPREDCPREKKQKRKWERERGNKKKNAKLKRFGGGVCRRDPRRGVLGREAQRKGSNGGWDQE